MKCICKVYQITIKHVSKVYHDKGIYTDIK